MRSKSILKFVVSALLMGTGTLALTGCGFFGNDSQNLTITKGNWSIAASSTKSADTITIGGNLTQSGKALSGTMYITGSNATCNFDPSKAEAMTGTVSGKNIALSSPSIGGQVITIAGSGSASAWNGTYSIAGGACDGDQGTVVANAVPSLTGTWNGTVTVSGDPTVKISLALTQASTPSADGTFALTGTATYTGSVCSASATLFAPSTVAGVEVTMNGDTGTGSFLYTPTLNSAASPTKMVGTYSISDSCASDPDQTVTLTKQ